jgi:hypothetical protein
MILHVKQSQSLVLVCLLLCLGVSASDKTTSPKTVRWAEGLQGCSFSASRDGKYHYQLNSDDLDVTLSVDAQELQLTGRRLGHFLGVFVEARYKGVGNMVFGPDTATIEYVNHYRVTKEAFDPETFAQWLESGAEDVSDEMGRQIEKHPDRAEKREPVARAYQKDVAELLEFVNTRTMKSATLSPAAPSNAGWMLFSTKNRWIGKWKKREELVFRIQLADRILEFPFTLPPKEAAVTLKERD